MVIYKCDKCGEINDYAHVSKIWVMDKYGNDTKVKLHLCHKCDDEIMRMHTDFLYGNGAYEKAKEARNFAMSYGM